MITATATRMKLRATGVFEMTDIQKMADALDKALDLLVEFMGESHPAIVRLQAPLCRFNVSTAHAHVRSMAVRQWVGGVR